MMNNSIKLLFLCLVLTACRQGQQATRPNIVLIYTDDQTFASVRALGNEEIHTPNLDRMVNSGTTFTHAYNMGGWHGAICVASRSMILSGSFLWNAKEKNDLWGQKDSLALTQTWSTLMKNQGYNTYMTGKWHVRARAEEMFEQARHIRPGMPGDRRGKLGKAVEDWKAESGEMEDWNEYMPLGYARPLNEEDLSWLPTDTARGGFWEGGKHWSEVVKDDALGFIDEAAAKENPFFMYLAFNAPHDPRQAPQRFMDLYPVEDIKLPENFLPEYPWRDEIGNEPWLRDEALAPFPRTEYAVRKHRQEYYAIISHLDEQVGKIIEALQASGKMDNTYIFFTADHGLSVGQHGLVGKQSLFDHSIRVPLMVMGPDVPQARQVSHAVYLQDIMATSLELAGIEKPEYVQFTSFMDLIRDHKQKGHYDAVYGAYMNLQRMVRKDGFKLLVYPKIEKVLLFDMVNDPYEMNDLSANPEYKDKVKALFQELIGLQQTMSDELELESIYNLVTNKTE